MKAPEYFFLKDKKLTLNKDKPGTFWKQLPFMKKSGERNAWVVSCRSHQAGTLILVSGRPIFLITLECQINKYLFLRLVSVWVDVWVIAVKRNFEQLGNKLLIHWGQSILIYTKNTVISGICIFWWLVLIQFIS